VFSTSWWTDNVVFCVLRNWSLGKTYGQFDKVASFLVKLSNTKLEKRRRIVAIA